MLRLKTRRRCLEPFAVPRAFNESHFVPFYCIYLPFFWTTLVGRSLAHSNPYHHTVLPFTLSFICIICIFHLSWRVCLLSTGLAGARTTWKWTRQGRKIITDSGGKVSISGKYCSRWAIPQQRLYSKSASIASETITASRVYRRLMAYIRWIAVQTALPSL